jgi:hypothetical protein
MLPLHRPATPPALLTWLYAFAALAIAGISCQSKPTVPVVPTYAVKGTVFLDQKPLGKVLVVFHPLSGVNETPVRSYAQTAPDGTFQISTFAPNDGAPAGTYRVTIHMQDEGDGPIRLPARYADPAQSELRVEVKAEPATLRPFHLRSN